MGAMALAFLLTVTRTRKCASTAATHSVRSPSLAPTAGTSPAAEIPRPSAKTIRSAESLITTPFASGSRMMVKMLMPSVQKQFAHTQYSRHPLFPQPRRPVLHHYHWQRRRLPALRNRHQKPPPIPRRRRAKSTRSKQRLPPPNLHPRRLQLHRRRHHRSTVRPHPIQLLPIRPPSGVTSPLRRHQPLPPPLREPLDIDLIPP